MRCLAIPGPGTMLDQTQTLTGIDHEGAASVLGLSPTTSRLSTFRRTDMSAPCTSLYACHAETCIWASKSGWCEGVFVLVSLYGVKMTTLSQTRSNHGTSTARTGPQEIQVRGQLLSVTNIHNSIWRPILTDHH